MSEIDDLAELLHEAPPGEPRSANRMRCGRKHLPKRDLVMFSISAAVHASANRRARPAVTLAKLNLPDLPVE